MWKRGRDLLWLELDDIPIGTVAEFAVGSMMVAMALRVRDHEMDRSIAVARLPFGEQPIDRGSDFESACPLSMSNTCVLPQQVEERRLEVSLN